MTNWDNDMIQFPRLLAEIMATQDKIDFKALAESMDLTEDNVHELFDRAQLSWEAMKGSQIEVSTETVSPTEFPTCQIRLVQHDSDLKVHDKILGEDWYLFWAKFSKKAEASEDQTLPPGETMWVTVGNLSVHLKHGDEGVSVSVYKEGKETEDSLAETWCTFGEGAEND